MRNCHLGEDSIGTPAPRPPGRPTPQQPGKLTSATAACQTVARHCPEKGRAMSLKRLKRHDLKEHSKRLGVSTHLDQSRSQSSHCGSHLEATQLAHGGQPAMTGLALKFIPIQPCGSCLPTTLQNHRFQKPVLFIKGSDNVICAASLVSSHSAWDE